MRKVEGGNKTAGDEELAGGSHPSFCEQGFFDLSHPLLWVLDRFLVIDGV